MDTQWNKTNNITTKYKLLQKVWRDKLKQASHLKYTRGKGSFNTSLKALGCIHCNESSIISDNSTSQLESKNRSLSVHLSSHQASHKQTRKQLNPLEILYRICTFVNQATKESNWI